MVSYLGSEYQLIAEHEKDNNNCPRWKNIWKCQHKCCSKCVMN